MILDRLRRPLRSLRLSVTDRCNLRCSYCMPHESYVWLPRESILSFEELVRAARVFGSLGARRIRLTGGEPLLRQDLPVLVEQLARQRDLDDLALTTNGILLAPLAGALRRAGLRRVTVSLDTLSPERMRQFARSPRHPEVLAGIDAALAQGFEAVKLNSVIVRGFNDDELVPLLEFARGKGIELRFIEYMDVGGATGWSMADVVSRAEMLERLGRHYGRIESFPEARAPDGAAPPAERFRLSDGTVFGLIASTTAPFCRSCDRSRLTADGTWFLCLYADRGVDLRAPLRTGWSDQAIAELIERTWVERADRGAEARAAEPERGALYSIDGLRADPRREMHTRGG
jgi:cyclic pyranopterin phosphate synthase